MWTDDWGGMHGYGGWWSLLVMLGVLLLLIVTAVLLAVSLGRSGSAAPPRAGGGSTADRLLDERFARGEIDEEEYRHRRAVIRGQ